MNPASGSDLRTIDKKFRPELEGVRAVAALLVAIYHIWLGSVSGGVDVFFIVSGYLITTSLVSKMEREGRIKFFDYILGLARRLFPIAFLVLFLSTVFALIFLPQVQWRQILAEALASAFYFQNWQLAFDSVDYLAQNNEASPFQHFWALSIQGQFYITWPLIIFVAFMVATKLFKTPFRKTVLCILSIIFIVSLSYSMYMTGSNQPWAYFDTFARAWEFSLGGILALTIPYLMFNKVVSVILGWLGLAIIALTGILLPVSTVFPGYAALLPISGVMLIIISAENATRFGVHRLLGSKPFTRFGSFSYGFYLWHWPLLIFYYAISGEENVSLLAGIAILAATFILSILTTNVLEAPIRNLSVKTSKKKIVFALVSLLIPVVIANMAGNMYVDRVEEALMEEFDIEDYPGAAVLYKNVEAAPNIRPITTPVEAESELPLFYTDQCYVRMNQSGLKVCSYGETEDPQHTVALVGGSRSGHWFPTLEQFAEELRIQIDVYNKDACRFTTDDFNGALSDSCMEWNQLVMEPLMEDPPDLIFTTANVDEDDFVPQGYIDKWKQFEGITNIFAIRDNPSMPNDIPRCVEMRGAADCEVLRSEVLSEKVPWENTGGIPSNVHFADLTEYLCDDQFCKAEIGNVLIYRDRFHLSTLYAMSLADPLKEHIVEALEQSDMN